MVVWPGLWPELLFRPVEQPGSGVQCLWGAGGQEKASQAPVWLVFTSPCGCVIAEVAFHLAITCAADKVHVSASERPPQEPQCWLQGASFCWGALLSVVPGPQRMLSHLFCLPVWEIVAQQLESCLVEHRRPSRAGG